ncbi:MAG: Bro-N domain-containing protein [Muribaculaceae bacterium]|nr:Bro-N domain-containing protein [Muribaculaceae bacterium]
MMKKHSIQIFNDRKVRAVWDEDTEEWYFSVVDVVAVLTDSVDPTTYWRKLKQRLKKEGNETVTNCHGLKLKAVDGKMRMTDVVDNRQLFRLIQSIPSPKAEPFKLWIANVAKQRLDQIQDPELSIEQAILDYRNLGYSEDWINQRIRSIEVRKALTDEWRRGGIKEGVQFASLTDIITCQWSGKSTKEYKQHKGLKKENLRDNMTNIELALNTLAEASATELSKQKSPIGFNANAAIAKQGGDVAKAARIKLESQLGTTVISSAKASDYILPPARVEDIVPSETDEDERDE